MADEENFSAFFFNFPMALTSGEQDGLDGSFCESFRLPQPSTPLLPLACSVMKGSGLVGARTGARKAVCMCSNAGT